MEQPVVAAEGVAVARGRGSAWSLARSQRRDIKRVQASAAAGPMGRNAMGRAAGEPTARDQLQTRAVRVLRMRIRGKDLRSMKWKLTHEGGREDRAQG